MDLITIETYSVYMNTVPMEQFDQPDQPKPMNQVQRQPKPYLDSEHYRQMLVRDGERRFQEWHTAFLEHQKTFRNATQEGVGKASLRDAASQDNHQV